MLTSASLPDAHGFFSLGAGAGAGAEYVAALADDVPVFLEANAAMPRTNGENQIHVREILGWCEADYPLIELPGGSPSALDTSIAKLVAERIPDGATLQAGIGAVPDQVLEAQRPGNRLPVAAQRCSPTNRATSRPSSSPRCS